MVLNAEQEELRRILTNELIVLRAKLRMSQQSLCQATGISRQTYTANETGRRLMSWNTFMLLYLFFDSHEETRNILRNMGDFTDRVRELMKTPKSQVPITTAQIDTTEQDNKKR